ncbi:MAG: sigma-54-dependent transcriptional regulator, partial [Nitrospiria bacterium]
MGPADKKILVVEDEANMRKILTSFLHREGYVVQEAGDGCQADELLAREKFHVVITDQKMPRKDGMTLLSDCIENYPDIPVILITAHGTIETAVKAMKEGAFDYITKPFDESELLGVVKKAVAVSGIRRKEPSLKPGEISRCGIIGKTPEMNEIFKVIDKVAASPSTVMITGETGTGKELIARALHSRSNRKDKPFIAINCSAIPENLIESELFGYEKGAFTGAVTAKPGRFELANNGTLFLDEIGDLKVEVQVKLLRVLQDRTFERVGGIRSIQMDTRLISATNRDLSVEVEAERFRKDLFYRLNVVTIDVPPLKDRIEDIPALAYHFIEKYNRRLEKNVGSIAQEAMQKLLSHHYPGNIRELENIMERAVLMAEGDTIKISDLSIVAIEAAPPSLEINIKAASKKALSRAEKTMIVNALEETNGNITRAAKKLGMSRRGLQIKMTGLGRA